MNQRVTQMVCSAVETPASASECFLRECTLLTSLDEHRLLQRCARQLKRLTHRPKGGNMDASILDVLIDCFKSK
jgi:hypothetical protein